MPHRGPVLVRAPGPLSVPETKIILLWPPSHLERMSPPQALLKALRSCVSAVPSILPLTTPRGVFSHSITSLLLHLPWLPSDCEVQTLPASVPSPTVWPQPCGPNLTLPPPAKHTERSLGCVTTAQHASQSWPAHLEGRPCSASRPPTEPIDGCQPSLQDTAHCVLPGQLQSSGPPR